MMRNNPEAERIEAEAKSLAIRINERLRTFKPTGRFTDDSYLNGFSIFSQPGLLDASGIREAQELADQMAGDRWEVRVLESYGGDQRFTAHVLRYVGHCIGSSHPD